jgi:hypothetical protein
MRGPSIGALGCLALVVASYLPAAAADPPKRKPLSNDERTAVLSLIHAVDVAQATDVTSGDAVAWDAHVLRSGNQTAYVPFRVTLRTVPDGLKSLVMYVRAVTRHDGIRVADERSIARDWLQRGNAVPARTPEPVYVGQGELPVGGPAASSSRAAVSGAAQAFTMLALQQRELEKAKAAAEAAKQKAEIKQRDPFVFPFEDYYVADVKPSASRDGRLIERALALPPGEYDVYIGMMDRNRLKTTGPLIVRRTITVPDFWNDELALSSLMLASDVNTLPAALSGQQQTERPYTFGRAEVVPVDAPSFTQHDVLSVVYQICNYGAPDADLSADYAFYRTDDGPRRLFNRTTPQTFGDADLPPPSPWETVAFATQAVPLQPFPPGRYELEITVRDRLTRRSATNTIAFTVK